MLHERNPTIHVIFPIKQDKHIKATRKKEILWQNNSKGKLEIQIGLKNIGHLHRSERSEKRA